MPLDVEVLAAGYKLVEAPRVAPDGSVWFSDALGGGVMRWAEGDGVEVVIPGRKGVGGMALHADGGAVVGGRDVRHIATDGTERVVFEQPEGVCGFNDLCALPGGGLLVGALRFRPFAGDEPVPGEFWRVDREGHNCIDVPDVLWANGCGVDVARGRIYACDYQRGVVWMRDADGLREFAVAPGEEADGLAVDDEGGVWVALPRAGALARFDPDGALERRVELPGSFVTSLAFDGDTMYVTTAGFTGEGEGQLLRMAAPVPGPRHLLTSL